MEEKTPFPEKVRTWLKNQGFPLEMRVARLFMREDRFATRQSDLYIDPTTGIAREIDVVADVDDVAGHPWSMVSIVGECKASERLPWVLFTANGPTVNPQLVAMTAFASKVAKPALARVPAFADFGKLPLFVTPRTIGYALRPALMREAGNKGSGMDDAYAAVMAVTKAAAWRITEADKGNLAVPPYSMCVFPYIVTSAPLFSCALGTDDDLVLTELQRCLLICRDVARDLHYALVEVLTEAALPAFVAEAKQTAEMLIEIMREFRGTVAR